MVFIFLNKWEKILAQDLEAHDEMSAVNSVVEEPVIHLETVRVVASHLPDIFDPILNRLDPAGVVMAFSNKSIDRLFVETCLDVATMGPHNLEGI